MAQTDDHSSQGRAGQTLGSLSQSATGTVYVPPDDVVTTNIGNFRRISRLSQRVVAERMRTLGFTWHQQTVGQCENGRRQITVAELFALALVFGVTVDDLLRFHDWQVEPAVDVEIGVHLGQWMIEPEDAEAIARSERRFRWQPDPDGDGPGTPGVGRHEGDADIKGGR